MAATAQKTTSRVVPKEVTVSKTPSRLKLLGAFIVKKLLRLSVLLIVLLVMFAAAILGAAYFKLIDPAQLEAKLGISQYPVITRLVELSGINKKPVTDQPDVQAPSETQAQLPTAKNQPAVTPVQPQTAPQLPKSSPALTSLMPDDTELKRLEALKREEEQKRISKVARLYDGMKPEEADF